MSTSAADFESLLRQALSPIEPPADLRVRVESALVSLTELAQEELESWELAAMRDPRNWARPASQACWIGGHATAGRFPRDGDRVDWLPGLVHVLHHRVQLGLRRTREVRGLQPFADLGQLRRSSE